jgi:hypothetical protein
MNMAETFDGINIIPVSCVPHAIEFHIRTKVHHSERTGSGAEIKETGIGGIHPRFHEIAFRDGPGIFLCKHTGTTQA